MEENLYEYPRAPEAFSQETAVRGGENGEGHERDRKREEFGGDGRDHASVFHKRLEPGQCLIPLFRNLIQIAFDFLERSRIELEPALAPRADTVHDSCAFQHSKVFRYGLSG